MLQTEARYDHNTHLIFGGVVMAECCIKGCDLPVLALGMCVNHWRMTRKHGSPVAERPLSARNRGLSNEDRFWKSVDKKVGGCWLWTAGTDKDGYGVFYADIFGVTTRKAHRFSHMLHTGEVLEPFQVVMHSCDVPTCVNPDHLSAGTVSDNAQDMIRKGRDRNGRRSQAAKIAKITNEQVVAILRDPRRYDAIAAEYGLHKQHVLAIKARTTRRDVYIDPSEIVRSKRGLAGEERSKLLTEEDVRDIRGSNEKGVVLAARYGVSSGTICNIQKRVSWKHVA